MTPDEQYFTADAAVLDAQAGPGTNYVGHWWCTDLSGRLLFLQQPDGYTPLCSRFERFVRENYPELLALHVPRVFVPTHFRDGVLLPRSYSRSRLPRSA